MRSRSSSLPTGTTCAGSTWTAPTTHCLSRCPNLSHAYQLPGPSTASQFFPLGPTVVSCAPPPDAHVSRQQLTSLSPFQIQGLNNAVALDFDYREQMIYWTDVTTQGSMIRRMHLNGSNVQVKEGCPWSADLHPGGPTDEPHSPPHTAHVPFCPIAEPHKHPACFRFSLPEHRVQTQGPFLPYPAALCSSVGTRCVPVFPEPLLTIT